jgi:hypothetical protein
MRLVCEVEGAVEPFEPTDGGAALAAFLSFAVSRGFGAAHPMIALADRLHDVHRVRFGPLTTFYELHEDDAEDHEKREMTWQPAGPLAEELRAVLTAIEKDAQCQALVRRADAPGLVEQTSALAAFLAELPADQRVRLGYEL